MHTVYDTVLLDPVHITPGNGLKTQIYEFLRFNIVDLSSTLICHKNEAFRKHFSNRRNLETPI